jgi:hypothetical protein
MASRSRSPAQVYALLLGVVLVAAGAVGFLYEASFSNAAVEQEALLGVLAVNGWHNLVHLATGVIGLLVAGSWTGARLYALSLGVIYLVITVLGFLSEDAILGLVAINTEDNILHLLIALGGVAAGLATPVQRAPTTASTG